MRRAIIVLAAVLALAWPAQAQPPAYRFLHSDDPVADANAYLLTLLAADPQVRAALAAEPDLQALRTRLGDSRAAAISALAASMILPSSLAAMPRSASTAPSRAIGSRARASATSSSGRHAAASVEV